MKLEEKKHFYKLIINYDFYKNLDYITKLMLSMKTTNVLSNFMQNFSFITTFITFYSWLFNIQGYLKQHEFHSKFYPIT